MHYSIFGYYGQGNAGDEAILSALLNGIKSHIPGSQFRVTSASPNETKLLHNVDAYNFLGLDPKSIVKGLLRKNRITFIKSILSYLKTDTVIIGGGGLFFDTPETNEWFFGYINLIHQAKKLGKKVALVGISVGPLHHKESEIALANAFSLVDIISVRDHNSSELLIKCGIAPNRIQVIPDLVFTLESSASKRIDFILKKEQFLQTDRKNIALTPCCYNLSQPGWLEQYVAFAEKAVNELNANLWLIPMQRGENFNDLNAIKNIVENLTPKTKKHISILEECYPAQDIQGILSKADFVLAERLHGTIMALNTNTQFMSIAYMPKVTGVLEQANLSDRIITMPDFLNGNYQTTTFEKISRILSTPERFQFDNSAIKKSALKNFTALQQLNNTSIHHPEKPNKTLRTLL